MHIPTSEQLGRLGAAELRSALESIDSELLKIHYTDSGELRELTERESKRLDELSAIRTRAASHLDIRRQFDRAPHAVQHATAGDRTNGHKAPEVMFRGDPWADASLTAPDAPGHRGELRGRALAAVEKLDRLPDTAKQAATRGLEEDDDREARLARVTVELSRPEYFSAWRRWFNDPQTGPHTWSPEERDAVRRVQGVTRAMALSPTSAGGFLTPYELDPNILISSAGSVNPMREVSRVTQTAYNEKRFVTSAGVSASWDAEAAEVSDDSPTLAQPPITCFKGAAYVESSYELDEDSDLAQQIGMLFADAKAQLEASAFTVGTGTGQPKGLITALVAAGGSTVIATASNVLAQADLYTNQASLPARWRPRARWMMNLSILNGYRQLPQASGLNYSVVNDNGPEPVILGWPVSENSSMDGTLTGSAADYALLSGDFKQYAIVDRIGTSIVPVPVVVGANRRPTGSRGWYLHWRTGADVLIADAFRLSNFST